MSEEVRFAELISKMAHELRSPLTSIKGFSATLVKRWDRFSDEDRRQFVETIHADAERMARIVSEVLDLARLEAGRLELHRSELDVATVAGKAVTHLSGRTGLERVALEVPSDLTVWADQDRLERGLANLIENALKFSESGPVTVRGAALDEGRVAISVTDEGIGISEDRLDQVFSGPAPRNQHAAPTGTGLGLHLTRRLLEAQGGSISVTSKLDSGSTFTVILPRQGGPA